MSPSTPPPTGIRLLLLLQASLTVMAGATIAPALPAIAAHFADVPHAAFLSRLLLTLPALLIAACAFPAGWLVDRFGRRWPLLAGLALYAVAGASGLVLDSLPGLLIGRAALGLAVALVMTTTMTLVGDLLPPPERERFMGRLAAFMSFGGVVFLTVGGLLAELGWRGPFAAYLLALPLLLLASGLPFTDGAPSAAQPKGQLPLGLAGLVCTTAVLHMIGFYVTPVQVPFLMVELGITAPSFAGLAIATFTLASALCALAYRPILARLGHQGVFALAFAVFSAGYLLVAAATAAGVALLGLALAGIGNGIMIPNYGTWLLARTPAPLRGRVSGAMTASFFAGQFLSPLATEPLVAQGGIAAAFLGVAVVGAAIAGGYLLAARSPAAVGRAA
jgi:MFS family permease